MGGILIWSELSIPLFNLVLVLILVLMVVFLSRVERVAIEIAFATVDQSEVGWHEDDLVDKIAAWS
jgi:hypothetical protein